MSPIGTLQENSLHASLKDWYARPGDQVEVLVEGYWVDILREDLLIEIQTRNFSALKPKLPRLLGSHPVRLVYPIAQEKWIVRIANVEGSFRKSDTDANTVQISSRRKSPKHGKVIELFAELVRIARLARQSNFSFEVLLIQEEEVWQDDGMGSWRRKGVSVVDRRLVSVLKNVVFASPADYLSLLPDRLSVEFTVHDLVKTAVIPRRLAGQMAYCLREMGVLEVAGKRGNALVYRCGK